MENNRTIIQDFFTADIADLNAMIEKYPWFTTARIRRSAISGDSEPRLSLNLLTKPWPAAMLHGVESITETLERTPMSDNTTDIIDRFLAGGDKRIVPKDDTPTGDVSEDSSVFVPDEDLDTEELERIYRDQGLELMNDEVSEITGEILGTVNEE